MSEVVERQRLVKRLAEDIEEARKHIPGPLDRDYLLRVADHLVDMGWKREPRR